MRFRPLLLLSLPLLLASCAKTNAPVRLDFIGLAALVSGARTVNPNDTLATRAYGVSNDNQLQRFRISVTYSPGPGPIIYPIPIAGFDPKNEPADFTIVYLDSLIKPIQGANSGTSQGSQYLFENHFSARSTSGAELWQYTISDNTGSSATRAYRLTAHKTDSAAVYHSYPVVVRLPSQAQAHADTIRMRRDQARVFLNLPYGLLLPRYAVLNNEHSVQPNQQLIDLIGTVRGTSLALEAPVDTAQDKYLPASKWPVRRATLLRRTTLTPDNFDKAVTTAAFTTAFSGGSKFADEFSTGTLAKTQVLAFQTKEGKTGLIQVVDIVLGTKPRLTCSVKVEK